MQVQNFLNAKIKIDDMIWGGDVEIHKMSSNGILTNIMRMKILIL